MSCELLQATGSNARILIGKETCWGSAPTTGYHELPIVGGETLDENVTVYRSNIIRADRTRNASTRGTKRPGGSIPMELAALGPVLFLLQATLGGTVSTTAPSAVSEVQTMTISGTPSGGTYRLGYNDEFTAPIAYNANAAAITSALEALTGIGTGGVVVTGTGPFTITFGGSLASLNVFLIEADDGLLSGGTSPSISIVTTTRGKTAGQYLHTLVGTTSSTLPSFTIEKGFTDLSTPKYQVYTGNRVNSASINVNVDQIATVSFDLFSKRSQNFTASTVDGSYTAAPTTYSFTSTQIQLWKDSALLGVATQASVTINNNLFGDTGFILGNAYRQNLKAGTRTVDGTASFIFNDTTIYDLARAGTLFQLRLIMRDEQGNQLEFNMPKVQLTPNGTSPKIDNDGPIAITANFESTKDSGIGSDIQMTVVTTEADIDY